MAKRKALTKKTRFEVFKRDSFSCQYCGRSAPDVVLHLDHIHPVAEGGTNEIINLVTACVECNSGKGARVLDDHSIAKRQIDQLKLVNERKEQLELMAQWRNEMVSLEEQKIENVARAINKELDPANREIADSVRKDIRLWLKKYTLDDIWSAIEKSSAQYLRNVHDQEQRTKFIDYIPRILHWQQRERDNPVEAELLRAMGIASKTWYRCNRKDLYRHVMEYHKLGYSVDDIKDGIVSSTGIMQFLDYMNK